MKVKVVVVFHKNRVQIRLLVMRNKIQFGGETTVENEFISCKTPVMNR